MKSPLILLCLLAAPLIARAESPFDLDLPKRPVAQRYSYVDALQPGEKRTWAELEGPGCIKQLWLTLNHPLKTEMINRKAIIRIFFDGSEIPHVEAPVGDFFGVMHGVDFYPINTPLLSVQEYSGYNCYFEMPFAKSARIELENYPGDRNVCYMQIGWHQYPGQELAEKRRFRASWRKENPTQSYGRDFLLLDAEGPGQLIGFVYGVRLIDNEDRWSHGGAENIYIDGMGDHPSFIRGIGGEDTFGTSFGGAHHPAETHLFAGMPYYEHEDIGEARRAQRLAGYRFFQSDTIPFYESIHARFGTMQNNICATVYWYQEKAPRRFVKLPTWEQLLPDTKVAYEDTVLPGPDAGSWQVAGPFELDDEPGRKEALDKLVSGEGWVKAPAFHGFMDFNHHFRPRQRGAAVHYRGKTAVAACVLNAEAEGLGKLQLAWDDTLQVELNGTLHNLGEHKGFKTQTIAVPLHVGENRVVVTLSNERNTNHGGWAFAMKATDAKGNIITPRKD